MKENTVILKRNWPDNLLYDISPKDFAPLLDGAERPSDFDGTLEYVLCSLKGGELLDETEEIIRLRYQDDLRMEETAWEVGLSVNEVDQAIRKALRYLNQLFYKEILCLGIKAHTEFASSAAWRLGYQCGMNLVEKEKARGKEPDLTQPPYMTLQVEPSTPIEVLGLSNRSINCLKRAGIRMVYELISQKEESICKMPNCGKSTIIEVKAALRKYHLDIGCACFSNAAN